MRTLLLLALTTSLAVASPSYPLHAPKLDAAAVAKRKAAFLAQNQIRWTEVVFDDRGFVSELVTDDPVLVGADLAALRTFVDRNTGFFGLGPSVSDKLAATTRGVGYIDGSDHVGKGEIDFQRVPSAKPRPVLRIYVTFFLPATATVTTDTVVAQVTGRRYSDAVAYHAAPQLDCGMTPAGPMGCDSPEVGMVTTTVTIARRDLVVQTAMYVQGDEIRLVHCVDATLLVPPPPDPKWGQGLAVRRRMLTPLDKGPTLPLVVDAVTGDKLAVPSASCNEIRKLR